MSFKKKEEWNNWDKIINYLPFRDGIRTLLSALITLGILIGIMGFVGTDYNDKLDNMLKVIGFGLSALTVISPFVVGIKRLPKQALIDITKISWCDEAKNLLEERMLKRNGKLLVKDLSYAVHLDIQQGWDKKTKHYF